MPTGNLSVVLVTLAGERSVSALLGCDDEYPDVDLEMFTLSRWEPVATFHGFYLNDRACKDVIRGLSMVARADGGQARKYRCVTENS